MAKKKLQVVITGDEKDAVRALGRVGDESEKTGGIVGKLGPAVAKSFAATAAAVAVGGAALFKLGSDFGDAYNTIRVGTGATGDDLEDLSESFRTVFSSVPTDMDSASTAISDLNTRLGLTGEPLEELSAQFLNLSRVTDTDVASNIESLTRTFGDWGIASGDQADSLDALFRASQATGIGVDSLGNTMVQFGAPMRQLGFEFDEAAALIGQFEKEGVNTELVLGSMRQALGKMAREGEPAIETFERVTAEIANAGSASEANAKALELFGARAGPDMAAAIREGRFEIDELFDVVANGSETIDQAAADTMTAGDHFKVFSNKAMVALEPLASEVFQAVGDAMESLGPHMETAAEWLAVKIPQATATLRDMWDRWGPTVMSTFERIQTAVSTAFATVQRIIERVSAVFSSKGGEVEGKASKIGEIISGLGDTFSSVFEAIQVAVRTATAVITDLWARFGDDLMSRIAPFLDGIATAFSGALTVVSGIFDAFSALFSGDWGALWEAVKKIFSGAWDVITGLLSAAWQTILGAFDIAKGTISAAWSAIWDGLKDAVTGTFDWVMEQVTGLPGRIETAASGAWDGIWDAFKAAINMIIEAWNNLSFTLPSAEVFGKKVGGWTLSTPNLPTLHTGGMFQAPTPGGEGLAVLRDGERVLTPNQQYGTGTTGDTYITLNVTVPVQGSVIAERDLVDAVRDGLLRESSRRGIPLLAGAV